MGFIDGLVMPRGRHLVATDLARAIWRTVGYCEFCERDKDQVQLQGAHIFGVGTNPRLRDDLRNGLSLCSLDHRRFTDNPLAFADWIRKTKYAKYLPQLKKKNLTYEKRFWDDRIQELRDIKKSIENGELDLDDVRDEEDYLGNR